jgi:hypothetical protein
LEADVIAVIYARYSTDQQRQASIDVRQSFRGSDVVDTLERVTLIEGIMPVAPTPPTSSTAC